VRNHQDSGSGLGSTGRFGLIRDTEASSPSLDANTTVEKKFSPTSKAELIMVANDALQAIEANGPRCLNKFPPEWVRARG
jgi:hypothetical protein